MAYAAAVNDEVWESSPSARTSCSSTSPTSKRGPTPRRRHRPGAAGGDRYDRARRLLRLRAPCRRQAEPLRLPARAQHLPRRRDLGRGDIFLALGAGACG
jgi:hypothetical protein